MLTVDQAAAISKKSSRLIYRMAEAGYVHFAETPEGFLLICLQSLVSAGKDDVNNPTPAEAEDSCEPTGDKLKPV
jgi:hypothetical protein